MTAARAVKVPKDRLYNIGLAHGLSFGLLFHTKEKIDGKNANEMSNEELYVYVRKLIDEFLTRKMRDSALTNAEWDLVVARKNVELLEFRWDPAVYK